MKEFFESVGRWFWNPDNLAYSISHIVLLVIILALVVTLIVFIVLRKKAHKVTELYSVREEAKDKELTSLKSTLYEKDTEIAALNKKNESLEKKIVDSNQAVAMNKEFAKIFKESLLVSRRTATIAVDTSNILDALSVDELKEYAGQIGAKIKAGMNRAEMIKVIRSTEVMRKNLEK